MELHIAMEDHGWKIFQFNFTDGTREHITSFIHTDPTMPTVTFHICNGKFGDRIDDEEFLFSYEISFNRKFNILLKDVTHIYIMN